MEEWSFKIDFSPQEWTDLETWERNARQDCELVDIGWQGLESNLPHTRLPVTNQSPLTWSLGQLRRICDFGLSGEILNITKFRWYSPQCCLSPLLLRVTDFSNKFDTKVYLRFTSYYAILIRSQSRRIRQCIAGKWIQTLSKLMQNLNWCITSSGDSPAVQEKFACMNCNENKFKLNIS